MWWTIVLVVCHIQFHEVRPDKEDEATVQTFDRKLVLQSEAPWMVTVRKSGQGHVCGGILVDRDKVITSADCLHDWGFANFEVGVGWLDHRSAANGDNTIQVIKAHKHPNFASFMEDGKEVLINDVAVLILQHDVTAWSPGLVYLQTNKTWITKGRVCTFYAWPTLQRPAFPTEEAQFMMNIMPSDLAEDYKLHQPMHSYHATYPEYSHAKMHDECVDIPNNTQLTTNFVTTSGEMSKLISFETSIGAQGPITPLIPATFSRHHHVKEECAYKYREIPGHSACLEKSREAKSLLLSDDLKQMVVDLHNVLRGDVNPPAVEMLKLTWDNELAMLAQSWADTCTADHPDVARLVPDRFLVGQNLVYTNNTSKIDLRMFFQYGITIWFNERDRYLFGVDYQSQMDGFVFGEVDIGHYTQMAWSQTYKVGCAATDCGQMRYAVCNYGPQGNILPFTRPYVNGSRCSMCQKCDELGLCDCGHKECNFAFLNPVNCQCECPEGQRYTGVKCQDEFAGEDTDDEDTLGDDEILKRDDRYMLHKMTMPIISSHKCNKYWSILDRKVKHNRQICAHSFPNKHDDGCETGRGGPLMCGGNLAAILSYGDISCKGCYPGVFTKLPYNKLKRWLGDLGIHLKKKV